MEETKDVKPVMKSPNERVASWYSRLSESTRVKLVFVFGDLDQPVTDILWALGWKFAEDAMPKEWS